MSSPNSRLRNLLIGAGFILVVALYYGSQWAGQDATPLPVVKTDSAKGSQEAVKSVEPLVSGSSSQSGITGGPDRLSRSRRGMTMGLAHVPLPTRPTDTLALLVGPEGGWAEEEISLALEGQCRAVSLGEHILRADTAAVTALSIVQSQLGRLG